jgi:hypothetical protein
MFHARTTFDKALRLLMILLPLMLIMGHRSRHENIRTDSRQGLAGSRLATTKEDEAQNYDRGDENPDTDTNASCRGK